MPIFSVQIGPNYPAISSEARDTEYSLGLTGSRHASHSSRPPTIQTPLEQQDGDGKQDQLRCDNADQKGGRRCDRPVKTNQTCRGVPAQNSWQATEQIHPIRKPPVRTRNQVGDRPANLRPEDDQDQDGKNCDERDLPCPWVRIVSA
jgi:hypothetical protein